MLELSTTSAGYTPHAAMKCREREKRQCAGIDGKQSGAQWIVDHVARDQRV